MVTGIVVTHGNLADELIKTAKSIFGEFDGCYPVSNLKKSPRALVKELEDIVLSQNSDQPFVVLIDFWGGSCCYACLDIKQRHKNMRLITGVNLPMLLAFLNKRDAMPIDELTDELIGRGRNSVRVLDFESL
jgi:mannose/fructose/sorbose-specific phosphotransferase system IIA component